MAACYRSWPLCLSVHLSMPSQIRSSKVAEIIFKSAETFGTPTGTTKTISAVISRDIERLIMGLCGFAFVYKRASDHKSLK